MNIHLSDQSVFRVLRSLIAQELAQSRGVDAFELDSGSWTLDTRITPARGGDQGKAGSLEADSLELVALATSVSGLFSVDDSGLEDYFLRRRTLGQWVEIVQAARARTDKTIGFRTSGSTGTPKLVRHRWQALEHEIAFFRQAVLRTLGAMPRRLLVPAPTHHIYGFLFGAIMADFLPRPVVAGPQALTLMLREGFRSGDLVAGYPFFWQQVVKRGADIPPGVLGLTSTGPGDPSVHAALKTLGLDTLMEIYGSTETAGIGWRTDDQRGFELLPRWRRGDYDSQLADVASGERHALPDRVQWQDERHLLPLGRRDQAVQVGGVNVYPERIAWHLQQLKFVVVAQVELEADSDRLKAIIIPADNAPAPEQMTQQLRHWCAHHLKAPERPTRFVFD